MFMTIRKASVCVVTAATAVLLAACFPVMDDFDSFTIDPSVFCDAGGCVGLVVETTLPRMLKGDTVRVYTRSDSGLASVVAWEVRGAGEMVPKSQVAWNALFGTQGRSILVRGLAAGSVEVIATHPLPRTAKTTLTVADSSVISA